MPSSLAWGSRVIFFTSIVPQDPRGRAKEIVVFLNISFAVKTRLVLIGCASILFCRAQKSRPAPSVSAPLNFQRAGSFGLFRPDRANNRRYVAAWARLSASSLFSHLHSAQPHITIISAFTSAMCLRKHLGLNLAEQDIFF
jgi:hypothetical protein